MTRGRGTEAGRDHGSGGLVYLGRISVRVGSISYSLGFFRICILWYSRFDEGTDTLFLEQVSLVHIWVFLLYNNIYSIFLKKGN